MRMEETEVEEQSPIRQLEGLNWALNNQFCLFANLIIFIALDCLLPLLSSVFEHNTKLASSSGCGLLNRPYNLRVALVIGPLLNVNVNLSQS